MTTNDRVNHAARPRLRPDTREAITTILLNTEATAHRFGWDGPPVLFGLFDHATADGMGTLEVDPSIVAPDLWRTPDPRRRSQHLPVPVVLHRVASDLSGAAARGWLCDWLHAGGRTCVGVGLLFEAWAGPVRPGYRRGDLANAPAHQRREVRVIAAVDTDLGLHRIVRVRGVDAPHVGHWPRLPGWSRQRGIVTGLCRLVHALRSRQHAQIPAIPSFTSPAPATRPGAAVGRGPAHASSRCAGRDRARLRCLHLCATGAPPSPHPG